MLSPATPPTRSRVRSRRAAPWLAIVTVLAVMAACSSSAGPDGTYQARGVITAVGTQLDIHHEAIPDYVSRGGKRTGMASMTMGFAVASSVSTSQLAPGTKVAFTFEVRFKTDPGLKITALDVLPPDTELTLPGRPAN